MSATTPTDRFGNPLDPIVRYARGPILKSTDEEVTRMLKARQLVAERVRAKGKESVFDLSGMNRGSGITADDVPHLSSHVPFFEHFEGKTEPYALKHMGADPAKHSAIILNRVSAANFLAMTTILKPGDRVLADEFKPKDKVDVIGVSKGRGFAGVVRRHHFRGSDDTHGSMFHRAPGSIGASSFPSRVFPGMRMGGQMGSARVTVRNLEIIQVDAEDNVILVKGAVPGPNGGYLVLRRAKS